MTKRSILITGCSSGIGLDAARSLQLRGWRVFATCRAEADCERLRSEGVTVQSGRVRGLRAGTSLDAEVWGDRLR